MVDPNWTRVAETLTDPRCSFGVAIADPDDALPLATEPHRFIAQLFEESSSRGRLHLRSGLVRVLQWEVHGKAFPLAGDES